MRALLLALVACAHTPPQGPIDLGELRVAVSTSRTAQLFHIVDQLSGWSPYCHRQYGRWFAQHRPLDDEDRRVLAAHAALRKQHGWGMGLEQAFYVDAPLAGALSSAVAKGLLTREEASAEERVLRHFEPILRQLIDGEQEKLEAFRERLFDEAPRLREQAGRFARFAGSGSLTVPVFLIANPETSNAGGGYNGGRLVLEVPGQPEAGLDIFLHEVFHAFLEPRRSEVARAALSCGAGLDEETLQEGIAYALSPGLIHAAAGDPLAEDVAREASRPLSEPYVRFHRLGLSLRGPLAKALKDGTTLPALLARSCSLWRMLSR
jgi:hypothetical protein